MITFGYGGLERSLGLNEVMKVQATWWDQCPWRRGIGEFLCFLTTSIHPNGTCEPTARRQPSASLEEALGRHPDTWSQSISLQSCKKHLLLLPLGLRRTVQQSKWIKRGLYSEKSQGHSRAEPYPLLLPVPLCCRRLLRNAFLISLCRRMQAGSRTEWIYIISKAPMSSYRSLG